MGGRPALASLGDSFGRLTVIGAYRNKANKVVTVALCTCGCRWEGPIERLRSGETKSCGCLSRETVTARNTSHGMSHKPEYNTWKAIKQRCYTSNPKNNHLYKDKGIKVCDMWAASFDNFYADMGPRPSEKHSIERKDSNKDYCPENCVWATALEQARNTSRVVRLNYMGEDKTLKEWCDALAIPINTIKSRLASGWTVSAAFETPVTRIAQGVLIDFRGVSRTVSEWSRATGLKLTTLIYRLKSGWSIEDALTKPVRYY